MNDHRLLVGRGAACIASLLFVAALAYPAVGTCINAPGATPHWFENEALLLAGWLAILVGQIGWFANIPFFLTARAMICREIPQPTPLALQIVFTAAAVISLQPSRHMKLPHFEGPNENVCALGLGFWLWFSAQVLLILFALHSRRGIIHDRKIK
jgi:hypothetical protein